MSQSIEAATARIETLEKSVSTLRHDLRGAIFSTSLIADALLAHGDPAVQRSGKKIAAAVERIMAILNGTLEIVPLAAADQHVRRRGAFVSTPHKRPTRAPRR
jgi:hypothetical protein